MTAEMQNRVHRCKGNDTIYSLEDRGAGWYLYRGDSRGENIVDSCPGCGRIMIHWPFREEEAYAGEIDSIIKAVVEVFGLTVDDLKGRRRDANTALARQVAYYLIRQGADYSLAKVGQALGGRSPAAVSYGYQRVADAINKDRHLNELISKCQRRKAGNAEPI